MWLNHMDLFPPSFLAWLGRVSKTQEGLNHSLIVSATTMLPKLSFGLGWVVSHSWLFPFFFFPISFQQKNIQILQLI